MVGRVDYGGDKKFGYGLTLLRSVFNTLVKNK